MLERESTDYFHKKSSLHGLYVAIILSLAACGGEDPGKNPLRARQSLLPCLFRGGAVWFEVAGPIYNYLDIYVRKEDMIWTIWMMGSWMEVCLWLGAWSKFSHLTPHHKPQATCAGICDSQADGLFRHHHLRDIL